MKIYTAPLEGITGHVFRTALHHHFAGADKYFIPFIKPNQNGHFSAREKQDILPEHNKDMYAVPQILTNGTQDFLRTAWKLEQYGYQEINLNLGCPSKTVISKKRGSGFLAYPEELEAFLDEIFEECKLQISIKTRIGRDEPDEFMRLLEIYNKYPIKELIIHPRVQKDFYKNHPNLTVFSEALKASRNPVCYNGDIFSVEEYKRFTKAFPEVDCIMIGRGLLKNPGLIQEIKERKAINKESLRAFHDELYVGYQNVLSGDKTILFKMKELWSFLAPIFTDYEKYAKKIKKCEKLYKYDEVIEKLFAEQDLVCNR